MIDTATRASHQHMVASSSLESLLIRGMPVYEMQHAHTNGKVSSIAQPKGWRGPEINGGLRAVEAVVVRDAISCHHDLFHGIRVQYMESRSYFPCHIIDPHNMYGNTIHGTLDS